MSETFIPISDADNDTIEDMFIKNNNSQLYMSAAASRRIGSPDYVEFLVNKAGDMLTIQEAQSDGAIRVKVTRRPDSEACRLAGAPRQVMRMIKGRVGATSASGASITFKVG